MSRRPANPHFPRAGHRAARWLPALAWVSAVLALTLVSGSWLLGAVALAAGGFALRTWPRLPWRGLAPWVRALWLAGTVMGLLLPALVGAVGAANDALAGLSAVRPHAAWPVALATAAAVLLGIAAALRWPERWPPWSFPLAACVVGLLVRLVFVAAVAVEPVSDFQRMWSLARQVSVAGEASIPEPENTIGRIHFQRTLPYFLPLVLAFGPSRWAYVLPNALLTVASSLLTWWLARRFFGERAGRVALVLSLLAVEPILASGIPSHDVPGSFLTMLVLAAFLQVDRLAQHGRWTAATAASLGLGMLLVVVELQRSNRAFLLLAFVVFLAGSVLSRYTAEGRGRAWRLGLRRAVFALVLPILVGLACDAALHRADLLVPRPTQELLQARALAGHTDSWSSGAYRYALEAYTERFVLDAATWRDLAWRKFLSDTAYSPSERWSFQLRKTIKMFALGSQSYFYFGAVPVVDSPKLARRLPIEAMRANSVYVAIFLPLLLLGGLAAFGDPRIPEGALLPGLYLAILIGALLLIFEPQPRYAFQIWTIGPIYAAALFRRPAQAPGGLDPAA